jgi:GMP synthase-like glutamine amidotransferase
MSTAAVPRRVLVIEHERVTPGGYVQNWFAERGSDIEQFRIDVETDRPDPTSYELIVSLGSEFSAGDDEVPFIAPERELLRRALDADIPVLGICFGGQLLARVLGADVVRAPNAEIGWLTVETNNEGTVSAGPWFQWHFDTFGVPDGATVLARSAVGPQAFRYRGSLGVQFHPEVTPEIMENWVRIYRHELDAEGVDPDELLAETIARAGENKRRAAELLEGYVSSLGVWRARR